ncbi:MAG: acyltransferase family protein [Oscillospiraceae bacterium]|jgi:hypothetical protein|nr:acyltransferase family protein [Oscillospiraceae bacterium]
MRKHYIDNLRWMCILFLFPYHTLMVYNTFGESFYVKGADVQIASVFITAIWPWFMPLLFLIAGVSSAYALKTRTLKEYITERIYKLLIPLLSGLLLLVPMQTYFAEVFHNGYTGSYFEQYILFFTNPTDLSGYHGGFTPAHLWFILYLFVISLVAVPLMSANQKSGQKLSVHKIPFPAFLLLFIVPIFSQMILDFNGKSVGESLTYFLFGYFLISNDVIQEKLQKYRFFLLGFVVLCAALYIFFVTAIAYYHEILFEILYNLYAWTAILAILGFGKQHLDFTNRTASYLSKSSFSIYIFHQQWIVITAYFALMWTQNIPLQMLLILSASTLLTFLHYEVFRRFSVTRFLFGIKTARR